MEAELAQVQKEKADLQAKLDAGQQEIAALQNRADEAGKPAAPTDSPSVAATQTADLQSQVDDLRRQLESAEKEKVFLSENFRKPRSVLPNPGTRKNDAKPRAPRGKPSALIARVSAAPSLRTIKPTISSF